MLNNTCKFEQLNMFTVLVIANILYLCTYYSFNY